MLALLPLTALPHTVPKFRCMPPTSSHKIIQGLCLQPVHIRTHPPTRKHPCVHTCLHPRPRASMHHKTQLQVEAAEFAARVEAARSKTSKEDVQGRGSMAREVEELRAALQVCLRHTGRVLPRHPVHLQARRSQ